tara:strand:- start:1550 stop:1657 length:108 start_codon:yes stop_codon:yes gene_type:complete
MKKIKLKIFKIIQDVSSRVSQWAWIKRILLMHDKK